MKIIKYNERVCYIIIASNEHQTFNILSIKRHLSEQNTLPALLKSLSTGAGDAGIGTFIPKVFVFYTILNTCLAKVFQLQIQILSFLKT